MAYIDKAKEANPSSDIAVHNINKLAGLSSHQGQGIISEEEINLVLGRYYAFINDQQQAKRFLGGWVKIGMELLSDDDPTNDWQGYKRLSVSLTFFGDDRNALAAWSLIGPNQTPSDPKNDTVGPTTAGTSLEISKAEADKSVDLNAVPLVSSDPNIADLGATEKLEGPLTYRCDGRCGVTWSYADDMYVCKDCMDVQLDSKCWQLLQSGQLSPVVCNPRHEFLHVPKYDVDEARKIGKGNVKVDDKIVPIATWLDGLKQEWGLASKESKGDDVE